MFLSGFGDADVFGVCLLMMIVVNHVQFGISFFGEIHHVQNLPRFRCGRTSGLLFIVVKDVQ